MKKIQISPSILSADFSQLGLEIKRLEEGGADMVHVDVMDGHFVPNLTIGPPVIKTLRKYTKLIFDVHLMISPVHKYIKDYADAGADIITFHPETSSSLDETISLIKSLNKLVGVSLNPDKDINLIEDKLKDIDLIVDDTDDNISSKIKKFNLIGVPYQIILGSKTPEDAIEFRETGEESKIIKISELSKIKKLIIDKRN